MNWLNQERIRLGDRDADSSATDLPISTIPEGQIHHWTLTTEDSLKGFVLQVQTQEQISTRQHRTCSTKTTTPTFKPGRGFCRAIKSCSPLLGRTPSPLWTASRPEKAPSSRSSGRPWSTWVTSSLWLAAVGKSEEIAGGSTPPRVEKATMLCNLSFREPIWPVCLEMESCWQEWILLLLWSCKIKV